MCSRCLEKLLKANLLKTFIVCPQCRKEYNKRQVKQLLWAGCLTFPANVKPLHYYSSWNDEEEKMVPNKRRCLERLEVPDNLLKLMNKIKDSAYIINNVPHLCKQIEQCTLMRAVDTKKLTKKQVRVLNNALYILRTQLFLPNPENYEFRWQLQYPISPHVNAFPNELDQILFRVVYWLNCYKANPERAQWRIIFNDDRINPETEEFKRIFDDNRINYLLNYEILSTCSLSLQAVIMLIDFLRGLRGVAGDIALQSMMSPGLIRDLCMGQEPVLRHHMKALVYAKMFEMNEKQLERPIPIEAITFSQAILHTVVKHPETAEQPGFVFAVWNLLGRALFSYLFRLLETVEMDDSEHIWNHVLNQDYLINNLPTVCEQMKQRMPDMLKSEFNMKKLNSADVLMLKKAVETLKANATSFVPDHEKYTSEWNLQLQKHPCSPNTMLPFPQNLKDVVTNWSTLVDRVGATDDMLSNCSQAMRFTIMLVDFFREYLNKGIF